MNFKDPEVFSAIKLVAVALVAGYVSAKALEKWDGRLPPLVGGCGRHK